jgi:tyrosyl-tRNA synthetase
MPFTCYTSVAGFWFAARPIFVAMTLVEELQWRGLIHDIMPGTEPWLESGSGTAYIGFDPTADSLHVGHFVPVMVLSHLQRRGHKVLAIIGGATGMIGDPSGKSEERNLLDEATLRHNEQAIGAQLARFLDFSGDNAAEVLNNYDWFRDMGYLEFIRDVGKHISINYMMAKESVKKRLETGISFTEFTYQLAQGYDFLHLYETRNCRLQAGGSDQWGNITTGTELIRRKLGGEAYALTFPLITRADGRKFGKTEQGNVWLDRNRTSPYRFYQYWLNTSDEDALRYLRIFTFLSPDEIRQIEGQHLADPAARLAQTRLAEDLTRRVHSTEDLLAAQAASRILFGQSTADDLASLDEATLADVLEGVPRYAVQRDRLAQGVNLVDLLTESEALPSRGEVRRALKENSLALNKQKGLSEERQLTEQDLLSGRYLLFQRGKKQYFLLVAE